MKQKQLALAEETEQIENRTLLLLKDLRMAQRTDITRYPEEYEQLISSALRTAEEVTCSIRHVMYNSGHKKSELMAQSSHILGITVQQEPQWLKVVLPVLLQRRRRNMNVEFLNDPLYYALGEYYLIHSDICKKYERAVVCFRHVYDLALPERRLRDYDNLEEKPILDTIALFALVDDAGTLCDVFNTTAYGDCDRTEIYIMEPAMFLPWLNTYKIPENQTSENQ